MSTNFVLLIGRVGTVEEKTFGDNGKLIQLSLATSDGYKDKKTGEWKDKTEWHRCILAIPSMVERASKISVGDEIEVRGSLRKNSWTDKDGNDRSMTEVSVSYFSTKKKAKKDESAPVVEQETATTNVDDDDLPF